MSQHIALDGNVQTRYKAWLAAVDGWRQRHKLSKEQALSILQELHENSSWPNMLLRWQDATVFLNVAKDDWVS